MGGLTNPGKLMACMTIISNCACPVEKYDKYKEKKVRKRVWFDDDVEIQKYYVPAKRMWHKSGA